MPTPEISQQLDTSELVQLLQQSAVEHLTEFRQLEAQEFGSVHRIATTDFEALYAYKRGEYQRCLQLSIDSVKLLIDDEGLSCLFVYPEFIQLMDDNIVSLTGLALIVNPSCRNQPNVFANALSQLTLSLYLMTQCQLKLHHSMASLAQTVGYISLARQQHNEDFTLGQLLLKLIERQILTCVSAELLVM